MSEFRVGDGPRAASTKQLHFPLMALLFVAAAAASATLASSAAAKQPNILFLLTVRTTNVEMTAPRLRAVSDGH